MEGFASQFENCAIKYPNNTAVLYCDNKKIIQRFNYNDLLQKSNEIIKLINKYVEVNSCIGISLMNNPFLPSIILGIHKYGCPFICIDIQEKKTQLNNLFDRVQLKWIIDCNSSDFEENYLYHHAKQVAKIMLLNYEFKLWQMKNMNLVKLYENISYIIQTSGTLGETKIVAVTHGCIMTNINSFRDIFKISENDIIFNGTPVTFDPFIIEIFLSLMSGATLLIVHTNIKNNNKLLYEILFPENGFHEGVTFLQLSPSVLFTFPENIIYKLICEDSRLRILALGGENFPEKLFDYEKSSKLQIYNLYGITEVSCWASIEKIDKNKKISIGKPITSTIFRVINSEGKTIENGEGQLLIGSSTRICLINDEELSSVNKIIYRETGDIVKIENNNFYYIGRKNSIIKRFGHRVCLLEIEKIVLETTDLISKCLWDQSNLFLFIILKETDSIIQNKIIDKIRIKLLHCLKKSQFPDFIQIIPNIPLTQNGKTDFKSLIKLSQLKINYQHLTPIEIFKNLFCKYFGLSQYKLKECQNSSFKNMGGNSILAIQIISEFENFLNNDNFSSELMGFLLDDKISYKTISEFIEKNIFSKNCDKRKFCDNNLDINRGIKFLKNECEGCKFVVKWKYDLKACIDASPVLLDHSEFGQLIIVGSHSYLLVILNALTGQIRSELLLPDAIESTGCHSICKNHVMIGCNDGFLYNINVNTAAITWKFETGSAIKCTPILCRNNTCVTFGSYDKSVYCLNIKNGSLIWNSKISEIVKSKPVLDFHKKMIYVTTLQGSCFGICEDTGKIIFHNNTSNPIFGSPCIYKDIIAWADVKGNVFFKNRQNFEMIKSLKTSGNIFSSLHVHRNLLLFGCCDHNVYGLHFEDYESLFTVNVESPISSTPCFCVFNDLECFVVVSNNGRLHLFDLDQRRLLGCLQLPAETFSSPVFKDGMLYIGCRDDFLYCLDIK